MLRSIISQLEYTVQVRKYCRQGIPFDKNLHVPEVSTITGSVICQREDEGHIFKVKLLLCWVDQNFLLLLPRAYKTPLLISKERMISCTNVIIVHMYLT